MIGFTRRAAEKIVRVVRWFERTTPAAPPAQLIPAGVRGDRLVAEITALANDYCTVKLLDKDGTKWGIEINVAKPSKLRHAAAQYPNVSTLTTTDTNTVDVDDGGSNEETWEVRPWNYAVGDQLIIASVGYSGVTVSSADLKWIDLNIDGRAWADTTGNVGSADLS